MKKILTIALCALTVCSFAQVGTLGGSWIYEIKSRHSIGAVTNVIGDLKTFRAFGRTWQPTGFAYLGLDTSNTKAAAGAGANVAFDIGSFTISPGLIYGTVWDGSPHFGFSLEIKPNWQKIIPPGLVHVCNIDGPSKIATRF